LINRQPVRSKGPVNRRDYPLHMYPFHWEL
jgi:hypothetical protein